MKRVLVGIVVCCAACTFDHGEAGTGGDDMSGGSEQDTDGDTVVDRLDNCPTVANKDQRNHDQDAFGDACDPCPHVIGGDNDTDGDGVGDGCDPHPAVPGDQIASFEGFYDQVNWQAVIGTDTWQVADGALQQAHTDGSHQLVSDGVRHDVFVDAKVRINGMAATTARRSAGLVLGYGDPNQYLFCLLATQVGGADLNAGEAYLDYYDTPQLGYNPATFDTQMVGDWVTLQARVRTITSTLTQVTCTSRRGSAIATISYDSDASPSGAIGVRTNGVDASFDYIFVVETPEASP